MIRYCIIYTSQKSALSLKIFFFWADMIIIIILLLLLCNSSCCVFKKTSEGIIYEYYNELVRDPSYLLLYYMII